MELINSLKLYVGYNDNGTVAYSYALIALGRLLERIINVLKVAAIRNHTSDASLQQMTNQLYEKIYPTLSQIVASASQSQMLYSSQYRLDEDNQELQMDLADNEGCEISSLSSYASSYVFGKAPVRNV
jgi:polyphosphate kinase